MVHWTLADYLRSDEVRLMGTKVGDQEGLTGNDVVVVIDPPMEGQTRPTVRPVLATLFPLLEMQGKAVVTIEGIGNMEKMHPLQKQFTECDASQCGYCLSGFIMSLYALLRNNNRPTCADIEEALDGNFCRCTGYAPIAAAAAAFAVDASAELLSRWDVVPEAFDESIEPAFPAVFVDKDFSTEWTQYDNSGALVRSARWTAPSTVDGVIRAIRTGAMLIGGNTHHVIGHSLPSEGSYVSTLSVPELKRVSTDGDTAVIGSGVTIAEFQAFLASQAGKGPEAAELALRFALSTPRRAMATIGGELASSGEEDLRVVLAALDGMAVVYCGDNFDKKTVLTTEIDASVKFIESVSVKLPKVEPFFYRQGKRRVSCKPLMAVSATFTDDFSLHSIIIGVNREVKSYPSMVQYLNNQNPDIEACMPLFAGTTYQRLLLKGILKKVLAHRHNLVEEQPVTRMPRTTGLPVTYRSWPESVTKVVGQPLKLDTAASKATGDVQYTIDMAVPHMLHAAVIPATEVCKKIVSIDVSEALKLPGVVDYVTADDIPGINLHSGILPPSTKVFQDSVTLHYGEPLGLILAESELEAREALKYVKVSYADAEIEHRECADITLGDYVPDVPTAIAKKSYHPNTDLGAMVLFTDGDDFDTIEEKINACDIIIEDDVFFGGQDHTYGEVQNCVVIPEQNGYFTVVASCQNMSKVQFDVAQVLNIPCAKVTAKTWHLGGGYGGKQDRPAVFATAASVAANKTKRPVKLVLSRSEDMLISGGRHPVLFHYRFGATSEGKLVAGHTICTMDGGSTLDTTPAVLNKCIFQSNGPYTIPAFCVEGRAAKTNRVTPTAYRGFGGPQGAFIIETVLDNVARAAGIDQIKVRELNLNREGDINIAGCYNQGPNMKTAEDIPQRCWHKLVSETDCVQRARSDMEFNSTHRDVKRAVGFSNVRNGTCFEERFMNQANALVHVIRDGSVVVAHSGVEMGQGLIEKVRAAVCEILPVDRSVVRILETSTDTCSNTQPTSASSGPDLNVPAVVNCCRTILSRLQPRLDEGMSWVDACNAAYFNAEDLHATSFFSCPTDLNYHWNFYHPGPAAGPTGLYCGYGASSAEIELDVLTGDYKLLRADLVEDAGRPLNPRVDLGQVEGGFIQGMALMSTEEIAWDGCRQETDCLAEYACPTIADVPQILHSMLLEDCPNDVSMAFKSKACEETPTLLGFAVFSALKEAVAAARADRGLTGPFRMDSPATRESILKLINE